MNLHTLLGHTKPASDALPAFIREIQDIRGVRVIRLQGAVGKDIGLEAQQVDDAAAHTQGVFARPLLFDFAGTTDWDFSTVAYMVQSLQRRMASGAQVGIINAPAPLLGEFEIAKVSGWFRVFDSEEQALAAFSGAEGFKP